MMHGSRTRIWRKVAVSALAATLLGVPGGAALAQKSAASPFAPGEFLSYRAVSGRFGAFGAGVLRVEGPVEMRGERALQLSFDFQGKVGVFRVEDRTRSWIEEGALSTLRFERLERSPLGTKSEEVEIFPEELRWQAADGETGETACEHPLDELSFIYFIRTLPLKEGDVYTMTHHFDPDRNPVVLRVMGRERMRVPAGEFATVVVEMQVSDERVSTMRFYLSDDASRIPVRIDSTAPWVGTTRLLLQKIGRTEAGQG
jgi:hypothetical protein